MGKPGPVPERKSNLSGHRSRDELDGETVSRVFIPTKVRQPKWDEKWHPIAIRLYRATLESGQCKWYEPSDYALLFFACDEISHYMDSGRTAMKLQVINQMLTNLLITEGERRRVQMEIDRGDDAPDEDAAAMAAYAGIAG